MPLVLDAPAPPRQRADALGVGRVRAQVAGLRGRPLVADLALALDPHGRARTPPPGPLLPARCAVAAVGTTRLDATVTPVHGDAARDRLGFERSILRRLAEARDDLLMKRRLGALEGEQAVGALLDDRVGERVLAALRVDAHGRPAHVDQVELPWIAVVSPAFASVATCPSCTPRSGPTR